MKFSYFASIVNEFSLLKARSTIVASFLILDLYKEIFTRNVSVNIFSCNPNVTFFKFK